MDKKRRRGSSLPTFTAASSSQSEGERTGTTSIDSQSTHYGSVEAGNIHAIDQDYVISPSSSEERKDEDLRSASFDYYEEEWDILPPVKITIPSIIASPSSTPLKRRRFFAAIINPALCRSLLITSIVISTIALLFGFVLRPETPTTSIHTTGPASLQLTTEGRTVLTIPYQISAKNSNLFPIRISEIELSASAYGDSLGDSHHQLLLPSDESTRPPSPSPLRSATAAATPSSESTSSGQWISLKRQQSLNIIALFYLDGPSTAQASVGLAAECMYANSSTVSLQGKIKVKIWPEALGNWIPKQGYWEIGLPSSSSSSSASVDSSAWQVACQREDSLSPEDFDVPVITRANGDILVGTRQEGYLIDEFLGIRYAAPPIGDRRWRPPAPLSAVDEAMKDKEAAGKMEGIDNKEATDKEEEAAEEGGGAREGRIKRSHKVRLAREPTPACPQPGGSSPGQNEDCLYLNVLTPTNRSPGTYLPVLVFLHGGGLIAGSGNDPQGLRNFIDQAGEGGQVVALSLNYRLNVLGFLTTKALTQEDSERKTSGNYGLLDQQMALQWVQEHIKDFGGDPHRVTLMGHSSGGSSILALLASPASNDLFHGAISLSGSPNITMDRASMEVANQAIVNNLGCGETATAEEELACLRDLPATEIVAVMPSSWYSSGVFGLPPGPEGMGYPALPVIDGQVLKSPILEAYAEGVVDVPLVLGNTRAEPDIGPGDRVGQLSPLEFQVYLNETFNGYATLDAGRSIFEAYQKELKEGDPQLVYGALISDMGLSCPNIKLAQSAGKGQRRKSPTYLFINEMDPAQPMGPMGMYPPPHDDIPYYARYSFHGWDLSIGMNAYPYLPSEQEEIGSQRLMDTWLAFIAQSEVGMQSIGWLPADDTPNWPKTWNTLRQGSEAFEVKVGYRAKQCAVIDEVGLGGPEFWWAN